MSTVAPHLNDVAHTWQQACTFLSPVQKFRALQTLKFMYAQLANSFTVQALFNYNHRERTQNIPCNACQQLTLFHLSMPVPTL